MQVDRASDDGTRIVVLLRFLRIVWHKFPLQIGVGFQRVGLKGSSQQESALWLWVLSDHGTDFVTVENGSVGIKLIQTLKRMINTLLFASNQEGGKYQVSIPGSKSKKIKNSNPLEPLRFFELIFMVRTAPQWSIIGTYRIGSLKLDQVFTSRDEASKFYVW